MAEVRRPCVADLVCGPYCQDTGKRQYRREREATAEAMRLHRKHGGGMHSYRCPACGKWHVGHTPYHQMVRGEGTRIIR